MNFTRRSVLRHLLLTPVIASAASRSLFSTNDNGDVQGSKATSLTATELFKRAQKERWKNLPIGEIMVKMGLSVVGTPYVGGTLETDGPEQCVIRLDGLDCVTFFENCLAFARCIKKGSEGIEAMRTEVQRTRYRDGRVDGYASRLHYTAEWISDNVRKGVVENISRSLGAVPFPLHVDFMSTHPNSYKQLASDPSLVMRIATTEQSINGMQHFYIPKAQVAGIESRLQSGDIIAIATSKKGLDYAHTGMIARSDDGQARFLHASLANKKVTHDTTLSGYLATVTTHIGVSVVRPINPVKNP